MNFDNLINIILNKYDKYFRSCKNINSTLFLNGILITNYDGTVGWRYGVCLDFIPATIIEILGPILIIVGIKQKLLRHF